MIRFTLVAFLTEDLEVILVEAKVPEESKGPNVIDCDDDPWWLCSTALALAAPPKQDLVPGLEPFPGSIERSALLVVGLRTPMPHCAGDADGPPTALPIII